MIGFAVLAEAMEFMLLSILSALVKCQWGLSDSEEALITSLVFIGFFLGSLIWGIVFHFIGRRTGIFVTSVLVVIFGILSALQISPEDSKIPGYPWLLVCRFFIGIATGGLMQGYSYYSEFLVPKCRGLFISLTFGTWWSVGTMLVAVLAVVVLGESDLGWHWFLGIASIPTALILPFFFIVPESARYYLVKGKGEKAQKVIERIAWCNCKEVPPGRVVSHEEKQQEKQQLEMLRSSDIDGVDPTIAESSNELQEKKALLKQSGSKIKHFFTDLSSLFTNGMWKTTTILLIMSFISNWFYFGAILLTTSIFKSNPHCGASNATSNYTNDSCVELDSSDYVYIMWTTAAEFPGIIVTAVLVELIGRKITIACESLICMTGLLLLLICGSDGLLTFFLFIIRAFASGIQQAMNIYSTEIFPTKIRTIGFGVCTASYRLGAIVTSYVAQVLFFVNDYATLSLYAGSCLVLAVLAMLLPIETKGRPLHDKETGSPESTKCCFSLDKCRKST